MKHIDLRKILRQDTGSVIMIVIGAVLTLSPDIASAAVSALLGWILVGVGAVGLLMGVLDGLGGKSVLGGVIALVLGIFLLKNPMLLAELIGIPIGIFVVSQGVRIFREARQARTRGGMWLPGMIMGVAVLMLGARLILSPLSASRFVVSVGGIVLVVCGLVNIVSHHREPRYIENDHIIDADE